MDNNQKIEEGIRIRKKLKELGIFGIVGPQGERGPKGDAGFASIEIGKVETIGPEDFAEVENVGTSEEVILNFKIPRGIDGKEGKIGPTGPAGAGVGVTAYNATLSVKSADATDVRTLTIKEKNFYP